MKVFISMSITSTTSSSIFSSFLAFNNSVLWYYSFRSDSIVDLGEINSVDYADKH